MKKNKILITGCAGFIGSNLLDELLKNGSKVIGIDNLRTGSKKNLSNALKNKNFKFFKTDLKNKKKLISISKNVNIVIHLAANADVRFGTEDTFRDIRENYLNTYNVLEATRINKIDKIVFSSTGSIYGEAKRIPTPENYEIPVQTSFYGAAKFSAESLIQSYSEAFGLKSIILRFVSILGPRYSHGHIIDFYKQLKKNKNLLRILGNGKQLKSYLHVDDCVNAINLLMKKKFDKKVNIFNLGLDEKINVNKSIKIICRELKCKPKIKREKKLRGWIGDNPHIHLDIKKIKKIGWSPQYNIEQSIKSTVKYLINQN